MDHWKRQPHESGSDPVGRGLADVDHPLRCPPRGAFAVGWIWERRDDGSYEK
jgi:hypothetical protein